MNIKGGALEFDIIANNGQINSALDETKRRIQGFTDATVEGGEQMEAAFKEIAAQIDAAFRDIDAMAATHSNAISDLKKEYARLGAEAGGVYSKIYGQSGHKTDEQKKIADEIKLRERLLQEIGESADALAEEERAFKKRYEEVQKNAAAQKTFRTQLREVREELAAMELAGETNSEAYAKLQARFGQLSEAMDAVTTQANILKKGERGWEGLISGISGVAGAFSAAQGAVSLFAGENENMQKIMVKIQSLMAITIGLREVQLMLDKDEAFMLVTLRKAKDLYTAAITRMSVALGISNVAAKALMATLTLGLSVAITAVITLVSKYISKTREAKKAQEEFNSKVVETAINPVASILELSATYNRLGDNIKAKEKFIEDNRDKFEDLGVSVKSVAEAEKLLIDNKEKFIEAQMFKAKALAATETATEKYKEALQKELELENTPEKLTQTVQRVREGGYGRPATFYNETIQVDNPEYKKLSEQKEALEREGAELFAMAHEFTAEEQKILTEIGASANKITEGSIAALEKTISALKTKYKEAATDTERTALLKQIQEQEALLKKIDLTATDTGGDKEKDPFTEKLEQRKKKYQEYANWLNSTNEDIRNSAKTEFAGLLADGESYEAYLKNLKRELEALPETADRNKKISVVSNELVSIEKDTYMDGYAKSLEKQISLADTLVEKLAIIADKRKELETDDSGLTKEKGAVLDTEQANIATQAQEDYAKAMRDYNDYLQSKIDAELSYQTRRRELEIAIEKETDAERKKILETQLKTLDSAQQLKQTMDYDALVEGYKTYQQKREAIAAEYDKKIRLASQHADSEALVNELEKAKENALSELTLDEIMGSDTFTELFGNLDTLTASKMIELRNKLESEWAKLNLSPKELEALRERLDEVNNQIQTKNPFKSLADAIKRYKETQDKDLKKGALKDIFEGAAASINIVKDSFDAVTGALSNMGLTGDEVTQQLLGDIGEMIGSAGQLATGIATGNPLGIIQGGIGLISSAFGVFNFRDRKLDRQIARHAANLKNLQNIYDEIERSVDKALGSDKYTKQTDSIENMKQQQKELAAMADAERAKKKTDQGKVDEYENQIIELRHQIKDTVQSMRDDIVGSTAADIAAELGNAFIEAFAAGENAAEAFRNKANEVVNNIIQNMLIKKLLEEPVGRIIDKYASKWIDDDGNFAGFDAVINSAGKMGDELAALSSGFAKAMESLPDEIKNQFIEEADPTTSLSGAIKGASQESIDLLAGQTNAVRVNQVQQIEVLRQQLIHLANIDGKLSVSNRHLESIDGKLSTTSDPFRPYGLGQN